MIISNILYHGAFGLVIGLVLGSFIGMASYRWLRREGWWGRSKCPNCRRTLGASDLIPILSFFIKHKQCVCGAKISVRYPVIEGMTGILAAVLLMQFGLTLLGGLSLIFITLLMLIIVIDWENYIIPNELVIWLFLFGLVWRWAVEGTWLAPVMGLGAGVMLFLTAFLAAYIVERMNEQESLGGGDLKLLFAAGPWVGFQILPALLIFSGFFGVLSYFIWKKLDTPAKQSADVPFGAFPYGPAICLAIYLCVIIQPFLIDIFS
jgi:prepilin signal peptidase PulO-like enzyme (type II secretory pathway)